MKFINVTTCAWKHATGDDGPHPHPDAAPHRLLTLGQWHAVRCRWPADLPVGLEVPNHADVGELVPDLGRIALIVLEFPKWTDGRAYSQAHLLRSRYRFAGALRARGEVLVDMMQLLARTGFDEVVLRGDQSQQAAQKALELFAPVGFYQGDVVDARPWFQRRSAV